VKDYLKTKDNEESLLPAGKKLFKVREITLEKGLLAFALALFC